MHVFSFSFGCNSSEATQLHLQHRSQGGARFQAPTAANFRHYLHKWDEFNHCFKNNGNKV